MLTMRSLPGAGVTTIRSSAMSRLRCAMTPMPPQWYSATSQSVTPRESAIVKPGFRRAVAPKTITLPTAAFKSGR